MTDSETPPPGNPNDGPLPGPDAPDPAPNPPDPQATTPPGPPFDPPPFEPAPIPPTWPPAAPDDVRPVRTLPRWGKWLLGIGMVLLVIAVAGSVIRVPYDTLSPGGTLNLATRVSVEGAPTYPRRGDLMLLFVRERTHVDIWRWVQAKIDPDIDLVKQVDETGGNSQQEADEQDVCDMSQAQSSAKVAALRKLGYVVPVVPGIVVVGLPHSIDTQGKGAKLVSHPLPAVNVLEPCDVIESADGHSTNQNDDLSKIIASHPAGSSVKLGILRAGKPMTVEVPVAVIQGQHLIGVDLTLRYKYPVNINVDTSDISGPSAGLAMTLAIIDAMTPGKLTGGKRVAVTGTIDPNGDVGEIGGLPQKAVAARASGAQIFIVPVCANDSGKAGCLADLATAKKRVGKDVEIAPVSTLDQALAVLRKAGGAPVVAPAKT